MTTQITTQTTIITRTTHYYKNYKQLHKVQITILLANYYTNPGVRVEGHLDDSRVLVRQVVESSWLNSSVTISLHKSPSLHKFLHSLQITTQITTQTTVTAHTTNYYTNYKLLYTLRITARIEL